MWLTVHDVDGVALDELEPGETAEAVFTVSTLLTTPPETFVDLLLTATTGEYDFEGVKQVVIGEAPVYSDGDIPTTHNNNPNTGSSALEPGEMTVSIPYGATITSVTVEYSMTAQAAGWTADQRSFLRCVSDGGETEPQVYSGTGNSGGTQDYFREGLTIANNVEGGGEIEFELHAFRVWGGSGSNTQYNFVDNNTWKLIVYYELPEHDVTFFVKNQFDDTLEDASVEVFGVVEETDGTGHAHFSLPEGSFFYNAWADDHRNIYNEPFEVAEGENHIDVELLRVFNAMFDVTDYHGNDLPDAVITIEDYTYEEGHYDFDDLLPGTYAYTVSAEGHQDFTGELEIIDQDVQLDVTLMPFYTAHFIVYDRWDIEVDYATITIDGETHEAGHYEIANLIPDTYSFVVSAEFYHDYEGEMVIHDGDKDVEVEMEPDGTDIGEAEELQLVVYPNPVRNLLNIESSELISDVRIIDMLGQVVYQSDAAAQHVNVDVSSFNNGIYLLQITTESGVFKETIQVQ